MLARAAEGVLAAIVPPLRSKTSPSVSSLDAPAAASRADPSPTEPSCSAWRKSHVAAAAWVRNRRPGLYDMQDVLGFRQA